MRPTHTRGAFNFSGWAGGEVERSAACPSPKTPQRDKSYSSGSLAACKSANSRVSRGVREKRSR